MKQLHPATSLLADIESGQTNIIWVAADPQNITVDDIVELVNDQQEVVGELLVNQLIVRRLGDFENQKSVLNSLVGEHTSDPTQTIAELSFTYNKLAQKRPLADIVVKKGTGYTEVKLYGDGGSRGNPGPAASGWVVYDLDDTVILEGGYYMGITTNNQAEYTALKLGLKDARKLGAQRVQVFMDSLLVVNQMKGLWKIKNPELGAINAAIRIIVKDFQKVTFTHVPRALNSAADRMVNVTLDDVAANN